MPDTTTQSIRSTGKRMGFSKKVIHDAVEEFLFDNTRPTMNQKLWNTPEKDFLFDAEWEYIKPKQSPMFGDASRLDVILKVNKALDDLEADFASKTGK